MRDAGSHLDELKISAVGISPDPIKAQKGFGEKLGLAFPLLSDIDHAVAEQYGVWQEKTLYGKKSWGIVRSSFLVGEDGRILDAWYKVKPEETVPLAVNALGQVS